MWVQLVLNDYALITHPAVTVTIIATLYLHKHTVKLRANRLGRSQQVPNQFRFPSTQYTSGLVFINCKEAKRPVGQLSLLPVIRIIILASVKTCTCCSTVCIQSDCGKYGTHVHMKHLKTPLSNELMHMRPCTSESFVQVTKWLDQLSNQRQNNNRMKCHHTMFCGNKQLVRDQIMIYGLHQSGILLG